MDEQQRAEQARELAQKILSLSQGTILLNMRFLGRALGRLRMQPVGKNFAADGQSIFYSPTYVLERYKTAERLPAHDLLHSVFHCIFRHWYTGAGVEPALWDLCSDIAAEGLILRLELPFIANERSEKKLAVVDELSHEVEPLTAEKLYSYLRRRKLPPERIAELRGLFACDDHGLWHREQPLEYEPEEQLPTIGINDRVPADAGEDQPEDEGGDTIENGERTEQGKDNACDESGDSDKENAAERDKAGDTSQRESTNGGESETDKARKMLDELRSGQDEELRRQWEQISREIEAELENFSKKPGNNSRYLTEQLKDVNREKYDYTAFLRQFAVSGEVMRSDPESFDLGYYSYGMELYGDVALIEPNEYREARLVREFVIAVDTSGSVSGGTVQAFLNKTYSILMSEENFFTKVNIHVIQCDTEVHDAVKLTDPREFEKYIAKMEIKGLGGTDFRPVFEYVDTLAERGEFGGLKGLIYFTDGFGKFPEQPPKYQTAFVFLRGDYEKNGRPEVPPWAIKIILDEDMNS